MKLGRYLKKHGITKQAFADRLGVSRSLVSYWASGSVDIPAEWCPTVERETAGEVRCEDHQPKVEWHVLRDPPFVSPPKADRNAAVR